VVYLHPVLGLVTLGLLFYAASLGIRARGIRARGRARIRERLLARHAVLAPRVLALATATWVAGAVSTAYLRDDLRWAETTHFRLGAALVSVMVASLVTSRRALAGSENAREVHVWLGVAAILIAAAQAFTGLRITP